LPCIRAVGKPPQQAKSTEKTRCSLGHIANVRQ
jgi:hypothetical protein